MAKPTKCGSCGRDNDASYAFCLDCGHPLRSAGPGETEALCSGCGARLRQGFRFCGSCGKPAAAPQHQPGGAAAPSPRLAAPPPLPHGAPARFRLAAVRTDGLPGSVFPLEKDEVVCGRTEGDIRIPDDETVSPRHARFTQSGGVLRVEDLGTVNGTYLRLRGPRRIVPGEELRVGRQLLRLEPLPRPAHEEERGVRPWGTKDSGYRFRLSQLLEGGGLGEIFPLREGENAIGREAGEVTFPSDRFVSARHARIDVAGDEVTLADAGSSNGIFLKIAGTTELAPGDLLLVGAQLLRID
jgi:pSer/pThr/pTyr-binding forkhead associated (FHA) protein